MDTFRAHYADMTDPAWQPSLVAQLRDHGLVTFAGITDRVALIAVARRLMTIRRTVTPAGRRYRNHRHGSHCIRVCGLHRFRTDPAHRRVECARPAGAAPAYLRPAR